MFASFTNLESRSALLPKWLAYQLVPHIRFCVTH